MTATSLRKSKPIRRAGSPRAQVMHADTEYGLLLKNTLDAIGPLAPAFLRQR